MNTEGTTRVIFSVAPICYFSSRVAIRGINIHVSTRRVAFGLCSRLKRRIVRVERKQRTERRQRENRNAKGTAANERSEDGERVSVIP